MFARVTTLHGDPDRMDTCVDQVDGEIRAAVEATPGNRGFAVLSDPRRVRVLGISYWDGRTPLRSSEGTLGALRDAAASSFGGGLDMENYELLVGIRHTIPCRDAVVRLTRMRVDPSRVDEAEVLMFEEVLTRVKGADGLCSFQLLRDRETGAGLTLTAWERQRDAEAFAPVAEQLRVRVGDRVGLRWDSPETYLMVRSTVQL
jgi:heme-degrading monooxygenase HmoA